MIYHAAFSIFGPCLKAISSMSFKLSNTYLKLFIMTAAASAMLVGSECLHRLYFDIVPLGRPWEEFLYPKSRRKTPRNPVGSRSFKLKVRETHGLFIDSNSAPII